MTADRTIRGLLFVLLVGPIWMANSHAEANNRLVHEALINATLALVWDARTTTAVLVKWMAPLVDIDLQIGGKMRPHYDPAGKLEDCIARG